MAGLADAVRRLAYGVPMDRTERIQTVRDEIVETAAENGWDWPRVEAAAAAARDRLGDGRLPEAGDEVATYLRSVCERYDARGCPRRDLRDAVDAVQANASARRQT